MAQSGDFIWISLVGMNVHEFRNECTNTFELCYEKTCLWALQSGPTQTKL